MFVPKISADRLRQFSPASLAYVGDAVYELYCRCYFLLPPRRSADYHDRVVAEVRAETQAQYLTVLEPLLTDLERDIVRRGRNAATGKPRRLSVTLYRQATGFEALIGYLYLTNQSRLEELFAHLPRETPGV
ncbi:ribonuclease III protein [[Synechococcus] sp. NIES-970]|uniref:Mini-ribonuclease 3 n=1 Tax=Picosynechococcus sp. NKBG15041c TaxID=1407650 RepID=UPI00040305ED|nr:ribonuclease III domain-containing protein [Picosynechococcus sp. NKBG15041c]BAW95382.1 ribonuclease III protein [[Synechococcus] sp. NIES-970]